MISLYGAPEKIEFCSRCVISNQRPSSTVEFRSDASTAKQTIEFDEFGVCSACRFADVKAQLDWEARERDLLLLLDTHRRTSGYDVVVPGSGGKDSAFTAHVLKHKYGMNPLTVTWAPHLFTDVGWRNLQNWSHVGALDNLLFTPNGQLHRLLTRHAFLNLLHPFQPFIIGQRIIGPAMAAALNIPLVMYGENQAEYGNSVKDNKSPLMSSEYFVKPDQMKFGGVSMNDILASGQFKAGDFAAYVPPDQGDLIRAGVEVHYLGYYLKWDPQECYYYAVENTGFEANDERTEGSYSKYSSIDDKIDPFHFFTTFIKFGIGRATYDAAQEIRNGKITREEGVELVRRYDDEFPAKYFSEFLDYVSIDADTFWQTVDRHRSPHLWRHSGETWALRRTVWE